MIFLNNFHINFSKFLTIFVDKNKQINVLNNDQFKKH